MNLRGAAVINPKARPCDEAAIRSVRPDPRCVASQKFWILVATILGSTMAFVDESVVNVALPAIEAGSSRMKMSGSVPASSLPHRFGAALLPTSFN